MKLKKEYLILAAIIVALSLYLFLRKTDRNSSAAFRCSPENPMDGVRAPSQ